MRRSVSLLRYAIGATILGWAARAHGQSQSNPIVVVSPVAPPMGADKSAPPDMSLLRTGIAIFVVSYGPSATVPIYSDHQGDKLLYIPFAGPWLDIASRKCTGFAISTGGGPFELASKQRCGTGALDGAALVTSGILQGFAALQITGAFFVREKRPAAFQAPPLPRFAIFPTIGANGVGAMARGRF